MNKVQAGLDYLNSLTPWNGRGGFALNPIRDLLLRLGNPQDSLPLVHVAGTNGKGSVSTAVASILGASGYKVGLNTSPHLERLNERIVVDGMSIEDGVLGELAYDLRTAANKAGDQVSFHEAITALAFLAFRELQLDWGVVEVGLGGRLDASNVITRPAATAIVTIDYDHQHILGETLAAIAGEKAGIIKAGSPIISGLLPKEALKVVKEKARVATRHLEFGKDFDVRSVAGDVSRFEYWNKCSPSGMNVTFDFSSPLFGLHQGHNMALAASIGLEVGLKADACIKGIEGAFWPGRLEHCTVGGRDLVLDSAHNPAGIQSFISFLNSRTASGIDLTFGALDTKNWQRMVAQLKPYVRTWRLLKPDSDRALPLELLRAEIGGSGNEIRVLEYGLDYEGCLRDLLGEKELGTAYVTGSMYMLGRLRNMLSLPKRPLWTRLR